MKKKEKSINELICSKMENLKMNGQLNTAHNYRTLLHFIERNYGIVMASQCGPEFVQRMYRDMSGLSDSTKASYFAYFKAIWQFAEYMGYTGKAAFPFQRKAYEADKVRIPRMARRTEHYLTRDDMTRIYNYWKGMEDGVRKRYIAVFLFSYLANGANVADLLRLTYNTDWFSSGGRVLSFVRHKTASRTGIKVRIPVTNWLKDVMDYLADEPVRGMPVLGSFLNGADLRDEDRVMKRIMCVNNSTSKILRKELKKIGIREDICVTMARHSYSTAMHHIGCPFALVEQALGHSNGGNIAFNYIGHFNDDDLMKWNEMLIVA